MQKTQFYFNLNHDDFITSRAKHESKEHFYVTTGVFIRFNFQGHRVYSFINFIEIIQ